MGGARAIGHGLVLCVNVNDRPMAALSSFWLGVPGADIADVRVKVVCQERMKGVNSVISASPNGLADQRSYVIGVDVGSTTVKVVVVNATDQQIVWSDYQRHETRQAEKAIQLLQAAEAAVPGLAGGHCRAFLTGSGAGPLIQPLGGEFVQEVNAVTLAVERMHPDVGSVVELGGQDAKIIVFQEDAATGNKIPVCSMNDKCASGTGATIDKCLIKIGMPSADACRVKYDPDRLHKVAAKCGVFAETDIVNLVKAGIESREILCSLADAIVQQNLSVLARGRILRHTVLLLGGPNTYLNVLRECWRHRIPETWEDRGYEVPAGSDPEQLIVVPENAEYYAAYGAALYGLDQSSRNGTYRGCEGLEAYLLTKASNTARPNSGPPLVNSAGEQQQFEDSYVIPAFDPCQLEAGQQLRAVIGMDGGSTSSKAVLLSETGDVLFKAYQLSKGNPLQDLKELLHDLREQVHSQGAVLQVIGFGVTGYAADVLDECVGADGAIVETVAHQMSAIRFFPEVDVICDVGGQDIKVLFMHNSEIRDFRLSNQCSAGNGMLLQAMADQFGMEMADYAKVAFEARQSPNFSYGCAVFLDSDRVNFQKEGYTREELLAGLARVLPKNIWQYVVQVPRLAEFGTHYVLQGGTQRNLAAVKAQVDYIRERVPNAEVTVHPHCGEAGAIGAGIEALRVVQRDGQSKFVGLESAIGIRYSTTNDETTTCHFCPNLCSRTFVDSVTPDGGTARYISGFSCERGTVESKEKMLELVQRRKDLKKKYVNLLEYEARLAFRRFYREQTLPEDGSEHVREATVRNWLGSAKLVQQRYQFRRSSEAAAEHRSRLRIGIPRVLNLYSTAPFFRTFFETLGVPPAGVCFSPATTEELFQEGAKYGAVDPCFPAKVAQSHIHYLLFHGNSEERPLDYVYFPTITHVPTFVQGIMDSTSCPIVAGTPNVQKAAFRSESDIFARCGVEYVDAAVNFIEVNFLKQQMFQTWGERLRMTRDESDFAVDQGLEAINWFTRDLERRGMEILDEVESQNRVALLVLGRPYHADPGLNHEILEQFQECGFPVLTIRSIPKDVAWLNRWFERDVKGGVIESPLDIRDVWPENFSSNSVQKVWAAKFAARHPNIAVLDLSSFKCGHDAPTYGLIDSIIKAGKTPYMALHDIDANKPSGSIAIRVKTYAYTLSRYEEKLREEAGRRSELEQRIASRRQELIAARRAQLQQLAVEAGNSDEEIPMMTAAFGRYLDEEEAVMGVTRESLGREYASSGPLHETAADIAPPEPVLVQLGTGGSSGSALPVLSLSTAGGCGSSCAGGCH